MNSEKTPFTMCATLADTFETVDVFMDQTINYVKTAPN